MYELLTGELPYQLHKGAPHEAGAVICEEPPRVPSRLSSTTSVGRKGRLDTDRENRA